MKKILIAGSSSISHALTERLLANENHELVCLTLEPKESHHPRLTWKQCNLFSLKDIELSMEGCEEAHYFARSKDSATTLNQGKASDYELIQADNFARAAKKHGLKQIFSYENLFASPAEITSTLKTSGVPVTLLSAETLLTSIPTDKISRKKDVRSIQRLVLPPGRDAEWVALEYFNWLPQFFSTLIKVKIEGEQCTFYLVTTELPILVLKRDPTRSSSDRQLLYVVGGLLAGKQERGRLEFREVLGKKYVLAALHEFRPALPWFIYIFTQAIVHIIVMKAFGEHLKWHVIKSNRPLPQTLA